MRIEKMINLTIFVKTYFVFWKHLQEQDRDKLCRRFVFEDEREAKSLEFYDILGTKGVISYLTLFYVLSKCDFLCISYC